MEMCDLIRANQLAMDLSGIDHEGGALLKRVR